MVVVWRVYVPWVGWWCGCGYSNRVLWVESGIVLFRVVHMIFFVAGGKLKRQNAKLRGVLVGFSTCPTASRAQYRAWPMKERVDQEGVVNGLKFYGTRDSESVGQVMPSCYVYQTVALSLP